MAPAQLLPKWRARAVLPAGDAGNSAECSTPDDLAAFITELRRRLERGDFADHPPIDLDNGHRLTNVEVAIRTMLEYVDFYAAMSAGQKRRPLVAARRRLLAENLRRLRERLKER